MMLKSKTNRISWVFSILLTVCFSYLPNHKAQSQSSKTIDLSLEWHSPKNNTLKLYYPENGQIDQNGVPFYSLVIDLPNQKKIKSAEIKAIQTRSFSSSEWSSSVLEHVENNYIINNKLSYDKNIPKGIITFRPIKKSGNKVEVITELEIDITYEPFTSPMTTKSTQFAENSVLRSGSGQWFKISVSSTGMYKINKTLLEEMGIDVSSLNPQHINIYGNAFGMLPTENSDYRPDDLIKNSIFIQGESDGVFNDNDYIVFYGRGPHIWEQGGNRFDHVYNIYDEKSYYYLNINTSGSPKRVANISTLTTPSNQTATYSNGRVFHEKDLENLTKSGKNWYGEKFDIQLEQTIDIPTPNPIGGSQAEIKCVAAIKKYNSSSNMAVSVNNNNLGSISPTTSGTYDQAKIGSQIFSFPISGNSQSIQLNYNRSTASELAWLDYIEINYHQQLKLNNGILLFRNIDVTGAGNITDFNVTGASSNTRIWDITDPTDAKWIAGNLSGSNYSIRVATDSLREFVAFDVNQLLTPTYEASVTNQNLHALSQVDYIIVSHASFLSEANRLADLHRNYNGLTVHVVEDENVYNEFSSGLKDPTAIKWFMKMFYERSNSSGSKAPKHLLLFGDGSYDPKDRIEDNTHLIPCYHSQNAISYTGSFVADDYFGLLDDSEGAGSGDLMDIGVGRLPVSTTDQAKNAVDKIEHYMRNGSQLFLDNNNICDDDDDPTTTYGDWRNKITLIADDEDNDVFVRDCKKIADTIYSYRPEVNNKFIMLDAYQQISTSGGQRYPEVVEEINRSISRGTLIMNYVGHGGESGLAQERVISIPQIQEWDNINKLAVFVSATCEFSRFDDPGRVSAGEHTFLNQNGGAICLFTTTRLVLISINSQVNISFAQNVFQKENDLPLAFGEIMRRTKNLNANSSGSDNFRNFTLLGDPALKIALPREQAVAEEINDVVITSGLQDTLKALSKITFSGYVTDNSGQKLTNYNGIITPSVFDKKLKLETLGQDPESHGVEFEQWNNVIYKGKATVKNGDFKFSFIVPKDINLNYGNGRISLYAHNNSQDNHGYNENFTVGGFDTTAADDNAGPDIEIFMNDENFVNGGMTDENPVLVAQFFDESGINTVGNGIGHDITAIIDNNTSEPINLNDFYEADLDTYKSGSVRFPLKDLEPGPHKISLKAWDVYNNSADSELEFIVAESKEVALDHVLNYPNPFTTKTEFFFEHNQVCHFLDTQIQIFTVSGKLVKTINRQVRTNGFRVEGIEWDGRDDFGDKIGRGVYVYRVSVYTADGETAEEYEKLVILN